MKIPFLDVVCMWSSGPSPKHGGYWLRFMVGRLRDFKYVQVSLGGDRECPFDYVPRVLREERNQWRSTHAGVLGLWVSFSQWS